VTTPIIMIDPNVRVAGNQTFSGLEDVIGDMPDEGDPVIVREPESGVTGHAFVTRVDFADRLIYLAVDWAGLRVPSRVPTPEQLMSRLGLGAVTLGAHTTRAWPLCGQLTA
jgi:hypothetical protein